MIHKYRILSMINTWTENGKEKREVVALFFLEMYY